MLWDWNHVIGIKMAKSNDTLQVVPDTSKQDLTLMHSKCSSCWSVHGAKWQPENALPIGTNLTTYDFDFFY